MCNGECDRLFIDDIEWSYCCRFWSKKHNNLKIDFVPKISFDENGNCKFFEKKEHLSVEEIINKLKRM